MLFRSAALWNQMLAVNLTGTMLCTQAAVPDMLEAKWGRVVNIASTAGLTGYAYVAAYCAAKHGVVGLTRALALEFAKKGLTVNAVCPGYTETDIVRRSVQVYRHYVVDNRLLFLFVSSERSGGSRILRMAIRNEVVAGMQINVAMRTVDLFPDMVIQMVMNWPAMGMSCSQNQYFLIPHFSTMHQVL